MTHHEKTEMPIEPFFVTLSGEPIIVDPADLNVAIEQIGGAPFEETLYVRFTESREVFRFVWPDPATARDIRKGRWASRYRRRYARGKR